MKLLKIFSLIIIALTMLHAEPSKKDTSDIEKEIRASETIEKQKETIDALTSRIAILETSYKQKEEVLDSKLTNLEVKKSSIENFMWIVGSIATVIGLALTFFGYTTKKEILAKADEYLQNNTDIKQRKIIEEEVTKLEERLRDYIAEQRDLTEIGRQTGMNIS